MENELTILDDKYILKEIISQTKNSKIYIGNLVSEPLNQIIIKLFKDKNISEDSFLTNVKMIRLINNPNITKLLKGGKGVMKSPKQNSKNLFYLIEEYNEKGQLFDYISLYKKGLGEKISKFLFIQIISGLEYYTSQGLFFNIIKFDNILLDKDYKIKITDVLLENIKNKINFELDNSDLAIILFSLVTGRNPKINIKGITKKKLDKFWNSVKLIKIEENLTKEFMNLFNKIILNDFKNPDLLLDNDINEVNYYEIILNDPWFEGIKIEDVLSNNNNCYDFVKKEFELRYQSIKQINNSEIYLPLDDSFYSDVERIDNQVLLGNTNSSFRVINTINSSRKTLKKHNSNKEGKIFLGIDNKKKKVSYNNKVPYNSYNKSISMNIMKNQIPFNEYFNIGAQCITFKKFKNNFIKIIHLFNISSPIKFMTKIVKICEMLCKVETKEKKFQIYCTKDLNEDKLIVKISLMKDNLNYDLIIQKIMGDYFNYISFYEELINIIN